MKAKRILIIAMCLIAVTLKAECRVRLNVLERIVVLSLLPREASFENWKIINDIKDQLAPTEKEMAAVNAKATPEGGMQANWDAVPDKEIAFGEITERLIANALKKLDRDEKLLPEHISVYRKFVLKEK